MSGDTAILVLLAFAVLYLVLGSLYAVFFFIAAVLLGALGAMACFVLWVWRGVRSVKRWHGREMFALALLAFLQLTRPDGQKLWLATAAVEGVEAPQFSTQCGAWVWAHRTEAYCVKETPDKVMEMLTGLPTP